MLNHGSNWMCACVACVQSIREVLKSMKLFQNAAQRTVYLIAYSTYIAFSTNASLSAGYIGADTRISETLHLH